MTAPLFVQKFSPTGRRKLAFGIALLMAALLILCLFMPLLIAAQGGGVKIQEQRELIVKYQKIANGLAADKLRFESLSAALSGRNFVMTGDGAVAVTRLEDYLRTMAKEQDLTVASLLPEQPVKAGEIEHLPISLQLSGKEGQLLNFLYALENSEPLLRIDRIEVENMEEDGAAMTISIKLHGFYQAEAAP